MGVIRGVGDIDERDQIGNDHNGFYVARRIRIRSEGCRCLCVELRKSHARTDDGRTARAEHAEPHILACLEIDDSMAFAAGFAGIHKLEDDLVDWKAIGGAWDKRPYRIRLLMNVLMRLRTAITRADGEIPA